MNTDRFSYKGMTVNGEWVYGYLSVVTKEQKAKVEPGFYISNKMGMPFAYDVRPETVGQCTGVKDKNGKLIYEGDVVKCDLDNLRKNLINQVVWWKGCFCMKRCGIVQKHVYEYYNFEIIGNIHEMEVCQ